MSRCDEMPELVTCGPEWGTAYYRLPGGREARVQIRIADTVPTPPALTVIKKDGSAKRVQAHDFIPGPMRYCKCAAAGVGADAGSADARLVLALALIAGALWLCYLAPILAALVFLPAAVSAAVLLVVVWRAERREAAQRDRAVVRDLVEFRRDRDALRLPPLSPEAMERIRRGEGSL